jgi:hypothetical protein
MIDIASRATKGIKIPGRKATRAEIIWLFKDYLTRLKTKLNVRCLWLFLLWFLISVFPSNAISGAVNVTCDEWQASNTDGCFAVTGHWIEEDSPTVWECKRALLGFTKLNNAHNGKRLGGAFFKVLDRVGIVHKVCFVVTQIGNCL